MLTSVFALNTARYRGTSSCSQTDFTGSCPLPGGRGREQMEHSLGPSSKHDCFHYSLKPPSPGEGEKENTFAGGTGQCIERACPTRNDSVVNSVVVACIFHDDNLTAILFGYLVVLNVRKSLEFFVKYVHKSLSFHMFFTISCPLAPLGDFELVCVIYCSALLSPLQRPFLQSSVRASPSTLSLLPPHLLPPLPLFHSPLRLLLTTDPLLLNQ